MVGGNLPFSLNIGVNNRPCAVLRGDCHNVHALLHSLFRF